MFKYIIASIIADWKSEQQHKPEASGPLWQQHFIPWRYSSSTQPQGNFTESSPQ